jgi:uncharacterized ferritin-like protein (DUF455 family)
MMHARLPTRALDTLLASDPSRKQALVQALRKDWHAGRLQAEDPEPPRPIEIPGRPPRPLLVAPRQLRQRKLSSPEGRAILVHALAHIEFNAINLALDAVYRFRGMPAEYYGDWLRVAAEEAEHFGLLRERLRALGHDYGDFPAHNGLWEMACKTADDVLVRMALVPRVLEARGLDVTPDMIRRLEVAGDPETVAILRIIFRDEIGHVEIGSRWYRYCCARRGLDPVATFRVLLERHMQGRIKGPFAEQARAQAGFDGEEMDLLRELAGEGDGRSSG